MKYLPYTIFALGFIFNTTGGLLRNYSDNRTATVISQIGYLLLCVFFMNMIFSIYKRMHNKPILGTAICSIGNGLTLLAGFLQLLNELQPDENGQFTAAQKAILTGISASQGIMILGNFFFNTKYTEFKVVEEKQENTIESVQIKIN